MAEKPQVLVLPVSAAEEKRWQLEIPKDMKCVSDGVNYGVERPEDLPEEKWSTIVGPARKKQKQVDLTGEACFSRIRSAFGDFSVEVRSPTHSGGMASFDAAQKFFSALKELGIFPPGAEIFEKDKEVWGRVPASGDHYRAYCALTAIRWTQCYAPFVCAFNQVRSLEPETPVLQVLCATLEWAGGNLNHSFIGYDSGKSLRNPLLGLGFRLFWEDSPLARIIKKKSPISTRAGNPTNINSWSENATGHILPTIDAMTDWGSVKTSQFFLRKNIHFLSPALRPLFLDEWTSKEQVLEFLKATFTKAIDFKEL